MKRLTGILGFTAVLAMLIASCGQAATPVDTEAPLAPAGVVELVYMRQAEGVDIELEIIEEFNKAHPNIHVAVDSVPAADNYSKLALTTESGTPPDVYMTYFTIGAATNGLAMDLTPFVEKEGDAFWNAYVPAGWEFNMYAGKIYGIPYRVAPNVIILNKKVAEDAGVPIPSNRGWSWDEFVAFAQKLTDPAKGIYGYCLTGSAEATGTDAQFQMWLVSNGGKMINNDGLSGFNSPEGVETLQFLSDLQHVYKITPPGTTSATEVICPDLLASGKVAMWMDVSIWEGIIKNVHPDLDTMLLPMPTNGAQAALNAGTGFAMSPMTRHPDEAWEFMKYLASDPVQKRWAMAAGWQPGNVAVLNDPEFAANESNATVAWVMQNFKIYQLSHYPDNANLEAALRNYLQAAYLGTMTPKEALEAAAAEWDPVLQKFQKDNWWGLWGW